MTRPDDDSELAAAFSALRREEGEECPPFAEVWRKAGTRSRQRTAHWRTLVAATAAAAIAFAVLAVWIGLRALREPVPSIAEWRSPTGFLLSTPGREILSAPAGLGHSVLDVSSLNKGRPPS